MGALKACNLPLQLKANDKEIGVTTHLRLLIVRETFSNNSEKKVFEVFFAKKKVYV